MIGLAITRHRSQSFTDERKPIILLFGKCRKFLSQRLRSLWSTPLDKKSKAYTSLHLVPLSVSGFHFMIELLHFLRLTQVIIAVKDLYGCADIRPRARELDAPLVKSLELCCALKSASTQFPPPPPPQTQIILSLLFLLLFFHWLFHALV